MSPRIKCFLGACLALAFAVAPSVPAQPPTRLAPDRLFAFHNNFWINLHHFLYVTARARAGMDTARATIRTALNDTAGYGKLNADARRAWDAAILYYDRALAKKDILFDDDMVAITNALAAVGDATSLQRAGIDSGLAHALERAAPAYRSNWWPRHRAGNARWIAAIQAMLERFGSDAAALEARIFHHAWSDTPVSVDAVAYANWAGAYTSEHPSHIIVGSTNEDVNTSQPFETIFHEVLHTMDDSLLTALNAAFRAQNKRPPRDPTHGFIFYTAGVATRKFFPTHVPMAESAGIWNRGEFPRMLPLLRQHWQAYLDGAIPMDEAVRRIAAAW